MLLWVDMIVLNDIVINLISQFILGGNKSVLSTRLELTPPPPGMRGERSKPMPKIIENPQDRRVALALSVPEWLRDAIRSLGEAEHRPMSNMAVVLLMEAIQARK